MRIAYVISGLVGGLSGKNSERKDEDLIENIINYCKKSIDYAFSNHSIDFFIFSWHEDKSKIIEDVFSPIKSEHSVEISFKIPPFIENTQRSRNHFSRWYALEKALGLVQKSERTYDYVICTRFDICWNKKLEHIDKEKFLLGRYVGEILDDKQQDFESRFNIDDWPNKNNRHISIVDMPDHVFGFPYSNLTEFKTNCSNESIKKLHAKGYGRNALMSHHRLLPGMIKEMGVKQKDIQYLDVYNCGGHNCGHYDILRYRILSKSGVTDKMNKEVSKPWGSYSNIEQSLNYNIKKIVVKPGQQPSYQYHHFRSEHWIIIEGEAEITIDDQLKKYVKNETIFIPVGSKHRVKNPSNTDDLVFIEVQTGSYFGEDDIVRVQDDYGRST